MKIIFALALFVVGVCALPQADKLSTRVGLRNQRLVTDAIASAIQDVSQAIKDVGLDPLYIENDTGILALPVPVLFSAEGWIEELLFTGLSEIIINSINFSIITNRLTFDISLPLIEATAKSTKVDVTFFGQQYTASAAGRFAIKEISVIGNVRVSIGIISGISVRSISIDFSLGGIDSALNVAVQGLDLSEPLNTFLGATIPDTLNEYSAEINELLEIVLTDIINENL